MVALLKIAVHLLADVLRFVILVFRTSQSIQTENLFLRRQLALFIERGVQPRRVDAATRVSLAILARDVRVAERARGRAAYDHDPVASRRVEAILAIQVATR
jgi:hypothetical protein